MMEEVIKKIIENLRNKINDFESAKLEKIDLHTLEGMQIDDIIQMVEQIRTEEKEEFENAIRSYQSYRDLLISDPELASHLSSSINKNKNRVEKLIDDINKKIELKNEEIVNITSKISDWLNSFSIINEYLYGNILKIDLKDLFNAIDSIKAYQFEDGLMLKIVSEVCRKMLNKELVIEAENIEDIVGEVDEEEIDSFEDTITDIASQIEEEQYQDIISEPEKPLTDYRNEKISFSRGMYSRFFDSKSVDNLNYLSTDCEFSLEEIEKEVEDSGLSRGLFALIILKLTKDIKNTDLSDDEIEPLVEKLEKYSDIYSKHKVYKKELEEKLEELENYDEKLFEMTRVNAYYSEFEVIFKKITELRTFVSEIKCLIEKDIITQEKYNELNDKIKKLITELDKYINDTKEKFNTSAPVIENPVVPIHSFVLFSEDSEKNPYILSDLFDSTRALIDSAGVIGSSKDQNYKENIAKLIIDLFKFGMPYALVSTAPTNTIIREKLSSQICFPIKGHPNKPNRDKPTDMWRFRPERNSNIRFGEREIKIPNDTKLFNQIVDIIKKVVPSFEISNDDFSLIINVATAVKKADTDLYRESINRYYNNGIDMFKLFYKDGQYFKIPSKAPQLKTEFNPEECNIFEKYVRSTISVLKQMEENDKSYDFSSLIVGGGWTK